MRVIGLVRETLSILIIFEDMPSKPQLDLGANLSIIKSCSFIF